MRFAGDAVRNKGRVGKARAQRAQAKDYALGDYTYRYSAPNLPPSINEMPEENINTYTKTVEPEFVMPRFEIPEFKA